MAKRHPTKPRLSASSKAYKTRNYAAELKAILESGMGRMDREPYCGVVGVDFGTAGFASRLPDPRTGLPLGTLSNGESDIVRTLAFSKINRRIYTQVGLFPLEMVMRIATSMGIDYPLYPDRKTPTIRSEDIVTIQEENDRRRLRAISVKSSPNLKDRDWELARLHEAYWLEIGNQSKDFDVTWEMKFRPEAPQALIANARWIESFHVRSKCVPERNRWPEIEAALYPRIANGEQLNVACRSVDADLSLRPGVALTQVRFYLATFTWEVDLEQEINPFKSLQIVNRSLRAI